MSTISTTTSAPVPSADGRGYRGRIGLAAGLAFLIAGAGEAAAQVRLVEAGIVCPRVTTGELVPAPGTEAGTIRRIDQETSFDLSVRSVPMMDDLSFGIRTALDRADPEPRAVTIVVTHPPMGPRGIERQEWEDVLVPGMDSLNLFTFEFPYEKVPGLWVFSVEVEGEPVVAVPFQVGGPDARAPVETVCFRFLSKAPDLSRRSPYGSG
jgi:hypothetical protein